jgi:hypothetical protein
MLFRTLTCDLVNHSKSFKIYKLITIENQSSIIVNKSDLQTLVLISYSKKQLIVTKVVIQGVISILILRITSF